MPPPPRSHHGYEQLPVCEHARPVLRGQCSATGRWSSGCRQRWCSYGPSRLLQHAIPQLLLPGHPGLRAAVLLHDGGGRVPRLHPALLLGHPLLQPGIRKAFAWPTFSPLSPLPHPSPSHPEQPGRELQVHGQQRGLPAGLEHHLKWGDASARGGSKVARF